MHHPLQKRRIKKNHNDFKIFCKVFNEPCKQKSCNVTIGDHIMIKEGDNFGEAINECQGS